MAYENEIWKPLSIDTRYSISNYGRIRNEITNKYVSPCETQKGYKRFSHRENGKTKWYSVHRLVAEAFIPNPDNLPFVNHKDENPSNNFVGNLEWCTPQYNSTYNGVHIKRGMRMRGINNPNYGKVYTNEERKKISEAVKASGKIWLRGKDHPCYGKHHTEETKNILREKMLGRTITDEHRANMRLGHNKGYIIRQYTMGGTLIGEFRSSLEASEVTGVYARSIRFCYAGKHKQAGGFIWEKEKLEQ